MMGKLNTRLIALGVLFLGLFSLQGLANERGGIQIAQQGMSQDIIAYGQMCATAIGEMPPFNCLDGVVIPITVGGGKTPAAYVANMACDRPSLLPLGEAADGQCVPNSRVLNLSRGDAQFAVLCRQKKIRPADSIYFDEVDIVAHSARDGSTCWFQAAGKNGQSLDTTRVPPPNEPVPPPGHVSARSFWNSPAQVARLRSRRHPWKNAAATVTTTIPSCTAPLSARSGSMCRPILSAGTRISGPISRCGKNRSR
jgi:hypothetical protein